MTEPSTEPDTWYAMHGHVDRRGDHTHRTDQRHTGSLTSRLANDHANVEVIPRGEVWRRYGIGIPDIPQHGADTAVAAVLAVVPVHPDGGDTIIGFEQDPAPLSDTVAEEVPIWGEPEPLATRYAAAALGEHATWLAMWFGKDHPATIATRQRAEAIERTTP